MKVLISCEFSAVVRDAFTEAGHDATSCDLEPSATNGKHYQGDVRDLLGDRWDLMIAFPPCTHLAASGARHFEQKRRDGRQKQAIDFFLQLANADIPKIAIENPVGIMQHHYKKHSQLIHPWQFGHKMSKPTCLWLKNLPCLVPTDIVEKGEFVTLPNGSRMAKWYYEASKKPAKERTKLRNTTFSGIAAAMAEQWGKE